MTYEILPIPEAFDIDLNFQFLQRSEKEVLHQADKDRVIKLLRVEDERILFRVQPENGNFIISFLTGVPSAQGKKAVVDYIKEWFDLESDLTSFYALAKNDKLLSPLVKKFYGYRIIGQPDLFESIIWAVLGQQINVQFAYTLKQRFVEQFGERLLWNNRNYFLFPKPEVVAELSHEQLLPLQFSRQKSLYTITIAKAFACGELSKEKLTGLPLPDAKEHLMKIKGIGNWTANYALMKTFRYRDAFPLEDAGIHNAIKILKNLGRKPTLDEVKKIFRKYKGWEAYATLYLWKSL